MTSISVKALADAVYTRLQTVANATGYQGEAIDVPLLPNSDGRAAPYWVLGASPGTPSDQVDLGDTVVDKDWLFQVTIAAGEIADLQALYDRVDAALFRWVATVNGVVCGPCKPPLGFSPGPIQLDRSVIPHRPFLALQYLVQITAS